MLEVVCQCMYFVASDMNMIENNDALVMRYDPIAATIFMHIMFACRLCGNTATAATAPIVSTCNGCSFSFMRNSDIIIAGASWVH